MIEIFSSEAGKIFGLFSTESENPEVRVEGSFEEWKGYPVDEGTLFEITPREDTPIVVMGFEDGFLASAQVIEFEDEEETEEVELDEE